LFSILGFGTFINKVALLTKFKGEANVTILKCEEKKEKKCGLMKN
jgi:hypothetical protein